VNIAHTSVLIACVAIGCSSSPRRSSPPVAAALDSFVPSVRIGSRAAPAAKRLGLAFLPYVGYGDTTFQRRPGVRGVALRVDQTLYSESDRPSWWARIASVSLGLATRTSADSVKQLLSRQLGTPRTYCYVSGDESRLVVLYFWPDHAPNGVLLTVPLQPQEDPFLTFGAIEPDSNRSAPGKCDAA